MANLSEKYANTLPKNISEDPVKVKKAKLIHEKARDMRGNMLHSTAIIETKMALMITNYFCYNETNKRNLFYKTFVDKFSLENKAKLLKKIIGQEFPEYMPTNKTLFSNIAAIKQIRDMLAHSVLDFSDETLARPIEEGISFIGWDDSKPITDKDFEEWKSKATQISIDLMNLTNILPEK